MTDANKKRSPRPTRPRRMTSDTDDAAALGWLMGGPLGALFGWVLGSKSKREERQQSERLMESRRRRMRRKEAREQSGESSET